MINIRKDGPTKLCLYNGKNIKGFSSIIPLLVIASALFISLLYFYPILSYNQINPSANIINTQSYPTQYGNWTINFVTNGTSDLSIIPSGGTSWKDIEPIEVLCGNVPVQFQKKPDRIFVPKYFCPDDSTLINKVLTSGVHALKFTFGSSSSYAHNLAGQTICEVPFTNIVYEFNDSSGQDVLTVDSSGNLYIKASTVTENSASVPSSTNGLSISVSGTNELMLNRTHAYLKGTINEGSVPSAGSNDVLIKNATNGVNLTLFNGTGYLFTLGTAVYNGSQAGCPSDTSDWVCNPSSGDIEYKDYFCNISSGDCAWRFVGNTKETCSDTCSDSGDNWLNQDNITDCELCTDSHTTCSQDCSTLYDYCDGSTVYDLQCGTTDESTPNSLLCTSYCFNSSGSTGSGVEYPYKGTGCTSGKCDTSLCDTGCSNCVDATGCSGGSCTTQNCPDNTKCNGDTCTSSGYCGYGAYSVCSSDKCTAGKEGLRCTGGSCTYETGEYIYDSDCDSGYYCSGGTCDTGACNTTFHCTGDNKCQSTCDGSGNCNTDYNCQDCNLECQGTSGDANCKRYNSCSDGACAGTTNCPANYHCSSGSGCVNSPSIQCNTTDYCSDSTTRCTGKTCDGNGNCNVGDECSACPTSCVNVCQDYTGNCDNGVCTTTNCASGDYCDSGSCTSGHCDNTDFCDGPKRCDFKDCDSGSCSLEGGCDCADDDSTDGVPSIGGTCGAECDEHGDCGGCAKDQYACCDFDTCTCYCSDFTCSY